MKQAVHKRGVNTESVRFHHCTAAKYKEEGDVTKLITKEQVQNKYSLRKSNLPQISHATCSSILFKNTALKTLIAIDQVDYAEKGEIIVTIHRKINTKIAPFK